MHLIPFQPARPFTHSSFAAAISSGVLLMALASPGLQAATCRPCSARCAPTGQNPCAAKNPCAANPCAAKANPCAAKAVQRPANYTPYTGNTAQLVSMGAALFKDATLSSNNLSCASCHGDEKEMSMYNSSFAEAYPHPVAMASNQYGIDQVYLDEMIQICMVGPMAAQPLPWESQELAAMTAYVSSIQPGFKPDKGAANPCAAVKPCAANPCAANNPCAATNPCAAQAPCAAI